jgi:hypothetical protein
MTFCIFALIFYVTFYIGVGCQKKLQDLVSINYFFKVKKNKIQKSQNRKVQNLTPQAENQALLQQAISKPEHSSQSRDWRTRRRPRPSAISKPNPRPLLPGG